MEKKLLRSGEGENLSIADMLQSHPFQYLSKLNSINYYCNKVNSGGNSYSSISRVKLPWKNFNIIKIPDYFKNNYKGTKKQSFQRGISDVKGMEENQKKFWKEHEDIIQKHHQEQQKQSKERVRPQTGKSENRQYAEKVLAKDRNNIFLKKILEKGTRFSYDEEQLKYQIIGKLKKLGVEKERNFSHLLVADKQFSNIKKKKASEPFIKGGHADNYKERPRSSVQRRQYLQFEKGQDIIDRYRKKVKEVDCSLPQRNIKRTNAIISNMEEIIQKLS